MINYAFICVGWADDEYFSKCLVDTNIFDWLLMRYKTWTSRLVVEFFLSSIASRHMLWRILNVAIMVLGAISLSKIFIDKKSKKLNYFICGLIILLPEKLYHSAGWITTTLNYSWGLFLGLFAMVPIRKIIQKEKISWYEYIFYFLAMMYATNLEPMCLILLVVYCVFTCYVFYLNRKLNWFLLSGVMINIASLVFILTCPGNLNRYVLETATWFPDYVNISFLRKIEMGYSSTLFEFIMKGNIIFLIFAVVLFVCVFLKQKNILYRLISLIPIVCSFIFVFFVKLAGDCCPNLLKIKNSLTQYGTGITIFSPKTWIPDIILTLVCLSIIFSLYVIFEDKKTYFFVLFILALGFVSRMIISFSPTIWASGVRTFMYMYGSILICSIMLFQEIRKYGIKRKK